MFLDDALNNAEHKTYGYSVKCISQQAKTLFQFLSSSN